MISKTLLNNVKHYKKRDASMDNQTNIKGLKQSTFKLPLINDHKEQQPNKLLKSKCMPLECMKQKKAHTRMPSYEAKTV